MTTNGVPRILDKRSGIKQILTTTRGESESLEQFIARHAAALEAAKEAFPPD